MKTIFNKKRNMGLKIQAARLRIGVELTRGTISNEDLISLLDENINFGLGKSLTREEKLLQEIYNCPFLLCDQPCLDLSVKEVLLTLLQKRYNVEVQELKDQRSHGHLTKEQVQEARDMLKYCYFYTSQDGEQILRRGSVKTLKDNETKVLKI